MIESSLRGFLPMQLVWHLCHLFLGTVLLEHGLHTEPPMEQMARLLETHVMLLSIGMYVCNTIRHSEIGNINYACTGFDFNLRIKGINSCCRHESSQNQFIMRWYDK